MDIKTRKISVAKMRKVSRGPVSDKQSDKSSTADRTAAKISVAAAAGALLSQQKVSRGVQERGGGGLREQIMMEPTYRLKPSEKFSAAAVRRIMAEVVTERMTGVRYSPVTCSALSAHLADDVKERVKDLHYDRYKIVCVVTMGERREQDVRIGGRCEWFTDTDNVASYNWQAEDVFCNVLVYGIYVD